MKILKIKSKPRF